MASFVGPEKCMGGGGISYTHALIWLFQNQNRKTCILHKPANYRLLIAALFTHPTPTPSVTNRRAAEQQGGN